MNNRGTQNKPNVAISKYFKTDILSYLFIYFVFLFFYFFKHEKTISVQVIGNNISHYFTQSKVLMSKIHKTLLDIFPIICLFI